MFNYRTDMICIDDLLWGNRTREVFVARVCSQVALQVLSIRSAIIYILKYRLRESIIWTTIGGLPRPCLFVLADWVRWMIEYSLYCQNVGWAGKPVSCCSMQRTAHLRFVREHVFYCLGTLVSAISGRCGTVYREESGFS